MKKTVIFGAGNLGSVIAAELSQDHEIVGFLDNNKSLWGKNVGGYKVLGGTSVIHELEYDEIVVASTMRYDDIRNELVKAGITEEKFNHEIQNRLLVEVQARVNFLRDFALEHGNESESVAVAEGGYSRACSPAKSTVVSQTENFIFLIRLQGFTPGM